MSYNLFMSNNGPRKRYSKDIHAQVTELYAPMNKEEAEEWAIACGFKSLKDYYEQADNALRIKRKNIDDNN